MILLDTTFLVDAIRESRQEAPGSATAWLASNPRQEIAICVPVLCELLVGARLHSDPDAEERRVRQVCGSLPVVTLDERVPAIYAAAAAELIHTGARLAVMDLLVASIALAESAPLLTRNVKHFERVPGLTVLTY